MLREPVGNADVILAASRPEDVFGTLDDGDQLACLRRRFRKLAATVHPDKAGGSGDAFVRLHELLARAQRAVLAGVYGRAEATYARLSARGRDYEMVALLARGDVANVFSGTCDGDPAVLKVARTDAHGHLLVNEAKILRAFASDDVVEPRGRAFVPELVDSFVYRRGSVNRRVNALPELEDFYTLEQVLAAYPGGVPWWHMAWMFRRLLVAVGFAHANGVVHSAVLPPHVLIHPEQHGLVLIDWTMAVTGDALVRHVSTGWRDWYPAEVLDREQPGPETDILMAVRCMAYVSGGEGLLFPEHVPTKLRAFFQGCSQKERNRRPGDAWGLKDEFDQLLGRRRFRVFKMPSGSGTTAAST